MADPKRLRIGIVLNYKPSWLGGIYYILNCIKILNFLDDRFRPEVYLFYNPALGRLIDHLKYPYLNAIPWKFKGFAATYILSLLKLRNERFSEIEKKFALDAIFPAADILFKPGENSKKRPLLVSWYADLQHKVYPEFFKKHELFLRDIRTRLMLRNTEKLVLSSRDTERHFRIFYTIRKDLKIEVFNFVSIIDDFDFLSLEELQGKYGIPSDYFLVSNQFLLNKNHKAVIRALAYLKGTGRERHVVITGNMMSKRFPEFIRELTGIIAARNLASNISLVGVIPRKDQLSLMKHSRAVIQPSLFEGWSTVIEDAKSLQVPVIASNIVVNMEQLGDSATYFPPHDYEALAVLMNDTPERIPEKLIYEPYEERMKEAANSFINIFTSQT